MAAGQRSNSPVIRNAAQALERFKYEIAQEVSQTSNDPQAQLLQQYLSGQTGGYGGDIPSRLWGAVGGHMVRRMIAAAEESLLSQVQQTVQQSFRQSLTNPTAPVQTRFQGSQQDV